MGAYPVFYVFEQCPKCGVLFGPGALEIARGDEHEYHGTDIKCPGCNEVIYYNDFKVVIKKIAMPEYRESGREKC